MLGENCTSADLSMNSKCFRKFHRRQLLSWFDASNFCLSRGGSLAVFTRTGRPADNRQLTDWLTASGTDKSYWIGFVRSWWRTTDRGDVLLSLSLSCSSILCPEKLDSKINRYNSTKNLSDLCAILHVQTMKYINRT